MTRKTKSTSENQGEGDYKSARRFNKASRQFVETHDVAELGREATPHSAEEAAEMKRAEEAAALRARGRKPARRGAGRSPPR